jgi:signal transduction histidine kinase/DNA-binding NarL/FixJ family response regulator
MQSNDNQPATLSILLVEDDDAAKKLLHRALSEQYPHMVVHCARNGAEGLELFKEHRCGVVLTDLSMPVMNGIEMSTAIRVLDPEAFIIAVTAYSDTTFLLRAIGIGVNQYLLKPVDLGKLFSSIDKHIAAVEDLAARRLVEQERESTVEFLRVINASTGIAGAISAAMILFRRQSGCSAVGVRLNEGEDYPYFVAQGFPDDFVRAENSLCSKDAADEIVRGEAGEAILDCMCGNVISGRFDPEQPFFTANGSFWTNSTTAFLATLGKSAERFKLRNRCMSAGFESVALIPLIAGQERIGLLQFNDQRPGVFSPEDIGRWERIASYLAIALVKLRAEEKLKKLNEELDLRVQERTDQLEKVVNGLESFSYSVSHDLRTPLHQICSYLDILSDDFGVLLPPEANRFLDRARSVGLRMGQLIDGLLELSMISRTDLVKQTVDLSELATQVCDWLYESAPQRTVELVIADGLRGRGDSSLLRQLWGNLLGNAWKYTAKIQSARIEFGMEVVSGQQIFFVRDNGVGFDMAYGDKLFGEFQRLHGEEYQGNGIGLATVKRIVERHGGKVWAYSKINEGATFYFTL